MKELIKKEYLEILSNKKWNDIINDNNQLLRVKTLQRIAEEINILDKENYETVKKNIIHIQKEINKFDNENVKPIKQLLLKLKDKVVGEYQKSTVDYAKEVKKMLENKAQELGIIEIEKKVITKIDNLILFQNDLKFFVELYFEKDVVEKILNFIEKWGK